MLRLLASVLPLDATTALAAMAPSTKQYANIDTNMTEPAYRRPKYICKGDVCDFIARTLCCSLYRFLPRKRFCICVYHSSSEGTERQLQSRMQFLFD